MTTESIINSIDLFDTADNTELSDLFDDIKAHLSEQDDCIHELGNDVRSLEGELDDIKDERDQLERVANLAGPIKDAVDSGCSAGVERALEVAHKWACGEFGPGSDEAYALEQLSKVR